jgi:hypothetical protein
MKETGIDCMKYRKSTHIAGVDVDMIIAEKGKCILTIKEAFYDTDVDVSGNKTSGYFLEFIEKVKPMVINSGNRAIISKIIKERDNCTAADGRNIGNWSGLKIELLFDSTVKMMGKTTGGIRVSPITPITEKPNLTPEHDRWTEAKQAVKDGKLEGVKSIYSISDDNLKLIQE